VSTESQAVRPKWPWFVGAIVVVTLLAMSIAIYATVASFSKFVGDPADTVRALDTAYATVDCELFEKITTADVRDSILGDTYSCAAWADVAKGFTVDGTYQYSTSIVSEKTRGITAIVETQERDTSVDPVWSGTGEYTLSWTPAGWRVIDYTVADDSTADETT
jgi:hypothetical protein